MYLTGLKLQSLLVLFGVVTRIDSEAGGSHLES